MPADRRPTLADLLIERRTERGLSQSQMADELGVGRRVYDGWEAGRRPQRRHAAVLSGHLGMTPTEILAAARRDEAAERIAELEREVEALRRRIWELGGEPRPVPDSPEGEWLSVRGAAAALGLDPHTVYRMIARDRLPASRSGRVIRIRRSELDAWVERQRAGPGA